MQRSFSAENRINQQITERFTIEDYQKIAKAEQIRNVSDYDDFYIAGREETKQQIDNAEYIVNKVERYFGEEIIKESEKQT